MSVAGATNDKCKISDEELNSLTTAIKNKYGVDFRQYERKSLKRGFVRLMGKNKIESLVKLWSTILRDRQFFKRCIDDLTVNLTELFRNPEIWSALDREVLDRLKDRSRIDVWHAGCSSGEEVYSMAMVAEMKGVLQKMHLLGTDISQRSLEKARRGVYPRALLKKYEKSLKKYSGEGKMEDLFELQEDGNAKVREVYREMTDFQAHNLVTQDPPGKFDIVFCRNVMIYFDDRLKCTVLQKLLGSLKSDGLLILGYYDIVPEKCRDLLQEVDRQNRIYLPAQNTEKLQRTHEKNLI